MLSDWEWKATAQRLDDPRYVAYCSLRTPRRFVTHLVVSLIVVGFLLFLVAADYVPMPPVRWLILPGVIWAGVLLLQAWFAFGPARRPIDRHDVDQEVARIAKQHADRRAPRREDWSESLWNHAVVALLALFGFMLLFATGVLPVRWGVLLLIAVSIAGLAVHSWLVNRRRPALPAEADEHEPAATRLGGHRTPRRYGEGAAAAPSGPETLHGPGLSTNGSGRVPSPQPNGGRRGHQTAGTGDHPRRLRGNETPRR